MLPERLNFLNRFEKFHQAMVNAVKEDKVDEQDFYIIMGAKCKSMNKERRERTLLLNKKAS